MSIKNTLTAIVLASVIGLSGCGRKAPENYIQGEVIERYGNITGLVESSGVLFGNESVKVGKPNYVMRVKTEQGVYTLEVDALDTCGSFGPQTIYNVAGATKVGTKIRFPTKVYNSNLNNQQAGFSSSKVGKLDPDDIEILQ
jgi:hypothetical protein